MRKLGVVLALLVLFGTLTVGTDMVSALETSAAYQNWNKPILPFLVYLTQSDTVNGDKNLDPGYYILGWRSTTDRKGVLDFTIELEFSDGSNATVTIANFTLIDIRTVYSSAFLGSAVWKLNSNVYSGKTIINATITSIKVDDSSNTVYTGNWGGAVVRAVDIEELGDNEQIPVSSQEVYYMGIHEDAGVHYGYTTSLDGIMVNDGDVYLLTGLSSTLTDSDGSSRPYSGWLVFVDTKRTVTFSIKDGLTGQSLTGVTVKEGSTVLGTIDDGGTLELTKGTHTLTFEKTGYWSVTKTIDVQSDMTVSVEMYPSSAAFKLENFPSDITIPENTIYELTFTLSPIQTSATYNTYLAISGLSNVISVEKDGSLVSPENGKYYLGDVSGPTQISIKFKAGAVGQHGFILTLTSNDAIMSKTYTTTKQVVYKVEPLPFSVQMPSEWQVGQNELRISESSGQSYLITAVLKDSSGNEVWSDSHAFGPYEAYTFNVKIPKEGSYTLELQWSGQTAVYNVVVNPVISLKTKVLNVSKGGSGAIVLHFKNPSSSVQYYTIKVSGGFLPKEINQSIAVAPYAEKDISVPFAVPDNLQYDAYELKVQVLEGDAVVFQDEVAVSVSGSSGFSLFGGGSGSGKTLYYGLAVLVGLGLFIAILRRR